MLISQNWKALMGGSMAKPSFLLKQRFNKLSDEMPELFKDIKGGNIKVFLMPFWDQQNI